MATEVKTVLVTSAEWKEPVVINAADFDPSVHKEYAQKKRGRPKKTVKESGNADG